MFDDLIVWYLFLGGSGAGALSALAALDLTGARARRRPDAGATAWALALDLAFFARGLVTGTVVLAAGAFCLLADLGRPERFFYVLTHPAPSVLTFGSFALAGALACGAALCAVALLGGARVPVRLVHALEAAAVALGACTMAYTGAFLATIRFVPLWDNPVLPVLFAFSSLSAGIALALACALLEANPRRRPVARLLARAGGAVTVLEALSLGAYLAWTAWAAGDPGAVGALALGANGRLFWLGFVGIGLLLPLAVEVAYTYTGSEMLLAAGTACAVAGGFVLRYCIVNAPLG